MDLEQVITQSVADAGIDVSDADNPEGVSEGTEAVAGDPAPTEGVAPAAATGDPAPPADAAASGAAPAPAAAPAKRQGPIPFQRHQSILDGERTKHKTELDALNTRLKDLAWAEDKETVASLKAMRMANQDPEAFAKILANDVTFGPLFKKILGVGEAAPAPAAPAPAAASKLGERPKPNVRDAQGNEGYDQAGLDALLAWERAQAKEEALSAFEERLKPFDEIAKERAKDKAYRADLAQMENYLNHARKNWEGFEEHEPAIKAFLLKPENRRMALHDAYRIVITGALKADRAKMRDEILAEMNGLKGKGQTPPRNTPAPGPAANGKRDLGDVIRASIEGME